MLYMIRAIQAAVVATMFSTVAMATEVHKWVDENGVVHFSDTKPVSVESQTFEVSDYSHSQVTSVAPTQLETTIQQDASAAPASPEPPLTAAQARREEMARKRQERKKAQAENEFLCSRHGTRLEQMEPARRVYYTDENGQEVRMDDNKRIELIEESRSFLAENCQ